ncbi:MAG: hypothetical protein ACOXZU_14190 [Bacteroidales bacterium]
MKKIILLSLILATFPAVSSAHEEPAKTLSEKKAKEKDREEILSKRISSYTVMKHSIANGSVTTHQERYLTTKYDKKGNISCRHLSIIFCTIKLGQKNKFFQRI